MYYVYIKIISGFTTSTPHLLKRSERVGGTIAHPSFAVGHLVVVYIALTTPPTYMLYKFCESTRQQLGEMGSLIHLLVLLLLVPLILQINTSALVNAGEYINVSYIYI